MTDRVRYSLPAIFIVTFVAFTLANRASAITVGMVDTFSSGGDLGWAGSVVTSLANIGPGGAGDHAAQVTAGGGGRIVVYSQAIPAPDDGPDDLRWTGNFTAAGIKKISLDVRHVNATPLVLRIGIGANGFLQSGGANGSGDTYVTNYGLSVPGDAQWHTLEFPVEAADFQASTANTNPAPNVAAALTDVTHFRFIHNPAAGDFRGDQATLPFFMDNVRAIGIPEPASLAMGALATAMVMVRRRGLV
jgi:hypothetical protein